MFHGNTTNIKTVVIGGHIKNFLPKKKLKIKQTKNKRKVLEKTNLVTIFA